MHGNYVERIHALMPVRPLSEMSEARRDTNVPVKYTRTGIYMLEMKLKRDTDTLMYLNLEY